MDKIASPWKRILAYFIELTVSWFTFFMLLAWFSTATDAMTVLNRTLYAVMLMIFSYPIWVAVTLFLIVRFGGTIGKLFTGIEIVDANKKYVSYAGAFFRNFVGYTVSSILFLGFIWVFIDKNRQGWHDQIAGTYVVTRRTYGWIFGVITLIFIGFVNLVLLGSAIANFTAHKSVYGELFTNIREEFRPTAKTQTYNNPSLGFSLVYPTDWVVQKGADADYVSDILFAPKLVTLTTWGDQMGPSVGSLDIQVSTVSSMFSHKQYQNKKYATTFDFYNAVHADVQTSGIPVAPGPPNFTGLANVGLPSGTIEVSGVRGFGSKTKAYEYWYVSGDKFYDILVQYPTDTSKTGEFEKVIDSMLASFRAVK